MADQKFKIEAGGLTLKLTIKQIEDMQVEVFAFLHARSYIFDNPMEFSEFSHGEMFTPEEKIKIKKDMS